MTASSTSEPHAHDDASRGGARGVGDKAPLLRSVSVFAAAVELWETAADCIVRREQLLIRLEAFERKASDPARLFEKGNATKERLLEARNRATLEEGLARLDTETASAIDIVRPRAVGRLRNRLQP